VSMNSRDNAGYTPLHGSCISSHVSISRCLIEYGADVNAASRLDGTRSVLCSVTTYCTIVLSLGHNLLIVSTGVAEMNLYYHVFT